MDKETLVDIQNDIYFATDSFFTAQEKGHLRDSPEVVNIVRYLFKAALLLRDVIKDCEQIDKVEHDATTNI